MNFLADYGSGSEDENDKVVNAVSEEKIPVKNPPAKQLDSTSSSIRKRKTLDISFLPPEIAAALMRGDTNNDSDDDDMYSSSKPAPKIASKEQKPTNDLSCALLSMLPAPKQHGSEELPIAVVKPPVSSDNSTVADNKPKFNFSYSTTTTSTTSSSSSIKSNPTMNIARPSSSVLDNVKVSKPSVSEYVSPFLKPTSNANNAPIQSFNSSQPTPIAPVYQQPISNSSAYQNYNQAEQQYTSQASSGYRDDSSFNTNVIGNKKRKERDLEHQLMRGDLSGIHNPSIIEVTAPTQWNSELYNEQQAREYAITQQFSFGKGGGGMVAPSKVQNRKHQLNSLALKAAETELAMLDAKGQRMKSKSETQGKYGW